MPELDGPELDGPELVALTRAIALDPRHTKLRWQAVSLVIDRVPSSTCISGVAGFVYLDDGTWQMACTGVDEVGPVYADLIASGRCGTEWIRSLFQVTRPAGTIRVTFEEDDPDRWLVEPPGTDAQAERLRPDFL